MACNTVLRSDFFMQFCGRKIDVDKCMQLCVMNRLDIC